jgi:ankyrin repeat protein
LNPCHLAAIMKNPRMEMIQRLHIYDFDFGSSLDSDLNTPLHPAAMYSDSAAMVRELAQLHPAALKMKNGDGDTPLHLAARYSDSAAMVRELAPLHPAALKMRNGKGDTPLHCAARWSSSVEVFRELVSVSPAALVTMNGRGERRKPHLPRYEYPGHTGSHRLHFSNFRYTIGGDYFLCG